jgi:hypothetical protein
MLDLLSISGPVVLLLGLLLSFIPRIESRFHLEYLTFIVFGLVALTLIMRKPVGRYKGPILPLVILIIPIFGITRMRFILSCLLGWGIVFVYFTLNMAARYQLKAGVEWDTSSDIIYQTINYGIGIIGGMVSHYRQVCLIYIT